MRTTPTETAGRRCCYQQGTGRVEGQVALQMLPECLGFLGMAIVVAGDDLIEIAVDAGTLHL